MSARGGYKRRAAQRGLTLVELMISLGLGVFILAGIISLVASVSSTRSKLSATSEQVENGRYAMQMLGEDISLAGFYGYLGLSATPSATYYTAPSPCVPPVGWGFTFTASVTDTRVPIPLIAYPAAHTDVSCSAFSSEGIKSGTEVLVVHRTALEPVAVASMGDGPYLQVSNCNDPAQKTFIVDTKTGTETFNLEEEDCSTVSSVWAYEYRAYFVASCESCSPSDDRPTLKMAEYKNGTLSVSSLVSGVEDFHISFGLDLQDNDGVPDCYHDDPNEDDIACVGWSNTDSENWKNVVSTKLYLLIRAETPTLSSASTHRVDMGEGMISLPADRYKRQVISSVFSLFNVSGPRE